MRGPCVQHNRSLRLPVTIHEEVSRVLHGDGENAPNLLGENVPAVQSDKNIRTGLERTGKHVGIFLRDVIIRVPPYVSV
jgi:hypothetical protein